MLPPEGAFEELRKCIADMSVQAIQRDALACQLPPGTGQGGLRTPAHPYFLDILVSSRSDPKALEKLWGRKWKL